MSLTVFLALCILGLDFMIYVLFKLTFGDKRGTIARQVAAHRDALGEQPPRPFLVASREAASAGRRVASTKSGKLFARGPYTTRVA
jgi:hypothetical protein